MSCCLRFWSRYREPGHISLNEMPQVTLDSNKMGPDCVIVKGGKRVCGTGAALANAPIVQNKAYFEMKIQSGGIWGVGLATVKSKLDIIPLGKDSQSWVLRSDGTVCHNDEVLHKIETLPGEGDIISCSYDHVELNLFLNGKSLQCPVTGIRGQIFPIFYVDDGAILDVAFADFAYPPPDGFEHIMFEKNIL
ncbi:SPRY domain-containing protein 7-like [Oscarella lobularis]|uniref:SPRY domain-containing protein 7-like n=1 Tax=Oscarella lobularis TaxID=121494 RepID=UPI0033143AB3